MILFRGEDGFQWSVAELPSRLADDASSLYFFSRGCTRRLTAVPRGWDDLSWGELDRLRQSAAVISADMARRGPALVPERGQDLTLEWNATRDG